MTTSLPKPKIGALIEAERRRGGTEIGEPTLSGRAQTPRRTRTREPNGPQKAAILVRLLISQGTQVDLSSLPEDMQTELIEQIAALRLVDRDTMGAVVEEFVETLEQVGFSFAGGVEGALRELEERLMLSPMAARRLRDLAAGSGSADPWERVAAAELDDLHELLQPEADEILAVVLSKLSVKKAAALLNRMPSDRSQRVTLAISRSKGVAPQTVARIGRALAWQLDQRPRRAFEVSPAERMGAILNLASSSTRNTLLADLEQEDQVFATGVRKAIFTFGQIHRRVQPKDVPRILRDVAQPDLVTALAATLDTGDTDEARSAEFLLAHMSQRMAGILRDEAAARGKVKTVHADEAMGIIADCVRQLMDTEIDLIDDED